ncbi:MAG: hypothetical protein HYU39_00260 [Thaumarchaeota archaeon]|nr:hypothetical protein [Nitrososphaerota archaeon]
MSMIQRVTIVLAHWCPHCDPPGLEATQRIGRDLGVPVRVLNIDIKEQEKEADEVVLRNGDWAEDYTIPQIFLEHSNGHVQHIFTGYSEGVRVTKAKLENMFSSTWYRDLLKHQNLLGTRRS